jgi:Glycosyl transferases group 1
MRILHWHVHGAWSTAFVQGPHEYLVPVVPGRGPNGMGRARTYDWPASVREVTPEQLADEPVDVVVHQRPRDLELAALWLGDRRVPAVYVEHDCPRGNVPHTRHHLADRSDVPIVHVTHFNALMWDCGRAPTAVVEHGVVDPGPLWTGQLPRLGVVVNDPARRGRLVGADLLPAFAAIAPVDLFGMNTDQIPGVVPHDLPQSRMHAELARRRVYVHPFRWTSLGLSLVEAMHLGMPVVALATTEAVEAVPPEAGACSNRMEVLAGAVRRFLSDPDEAAGAGRVAREAALARYGLTRFLHDWDRLLKEVTR